jgi:hypothetical protein
VALALQEINYSTTNQSVDETKNNGGLLLSISDDVKVIRHYYVSEDQKLSRSAGLVECTTNNRLQGIKSKYRQTILCHRCKVIGWRIGRYVIHLDFHRGRG